MTSRKKPTKASRARAAARRQKPAPVQLPAPVEAYVPAQGESELVMLAVCVDAPTEAMMALIGKGTGGLTVETFKAAFAKELSHGKEMAKIKVVSSLYLMAMSRQKGLAPTSAIFLTKMLSGASLDGANEATVTVRQNAPKGGETPGTPDPSQIIEVSFKIGDDSKIKDE